VTRRERITVGSLVGLVVLVVLCGAAGLIAYGVSTA
jgi:hypothetical protein